MKTIIFGQYFDLRQNDRRSRKRHVSCSVIGRQLWIFNSRVFPQRVLLFPTFVSWSVIGWRLLRQRKSLLNNILNIRLCNISTKTLYRRRNLRQVFSRGPYVENPSVLCARSSRTNKKSAEFCGLHICSSKSHPTAYGWFCRLTLSRSIHCYRYRLAFEPKNGVRLREPLASVWNRKGSRDFHLKSNIFSSVSVCIS